jgi:xylulokinase
MYSIPKLMHIKNKSPELYKKTAKICLIGDYIGYMLTGKAQIDYSLASRTMAFDIGKLCWNDEIMDAAKLDISLFSEPAPFGKIIGEIRGELSLELGLKKNAAVVLGGHDQIAAAVGSGVFDSRAAVDGAGSVECITPVFSRECINAEILTRGSYSIVPYAEPGFYACYAFSFTGGALLKWFADNLAGYSNAYAKKRGISVYAQLEGDAPVTGPTGILVLPHFSGAATPYMDYGSKGAIVGLEITHAERDIFYALMEGVCYEMRLNADYLRDAGITFQSLKATGGGANSRAWMQMKADVLNMPVTALESAEAGAAGCAMAAGAALGIYPDLRAAAEVFVRERETYCPRPEMCARYGEIYEKYKKLYAAVRPLL